MKWDLRYHPFPLEMRGGFYERDENGKTRFFEIHSVKYDPDEIKYLNKIGSLKESIVGGYLHNIHQQLINETTFFLYKLLTYYADPTISDQWGFNKSISDYEQHFFTNFERAREFCIENWRIDPIAFLEREKTSIP